MTPREKAISVLGQYFPMVSDMNMELIDSIIAAAREGMVGEDWAIGIALEVRGTHDTIDRMVDEKRVREIVMEADIATRKAFAKFVDQRLSAHRNEEHLPNGDMRRNAEPRPHVVPGNDGALYELHTTGPTYLVNGEPEIIMGPELPWTPKVGELVKVDEESGILQVKSISHPWVIFTDGTSAEICDCRPVRASDWIVEVEGFGKVEAWYDEEGYLVISIAGELDCWPEDRALYTIILDWLKTHNVPIKPFGWKEGE